MGSGRKWLWYSSNSVASRTLTTIEKFYTGPPAYWGPFLG